MFKRFSVWLALAGIVAAVLLVKKVRHTDPPPPPLAEPARAPFQNSIGARGIVESFQENVRIAPAVAGLVTKVNVKVGDALKTGDVLFEQDPRDAEALVKIQEALIHTLGAQVGQAQVTLADKKDSWERMEKLSASQVSSLDERQRARFAVETATSQLAVTRAELAAAQVQVARSKVQLDLLTVQAPRDGTVLQVNIRAGEYAALHASEPALLLGQIDELQLRADVDEDNASRVRPGCRAVSYLKGRRDHEIPLTFVRIEPYILPKKSLTGESSERVDTRVLQIIFRFEKTKTPVYVGQQVDVFIDAGEPATPAPAPR
ncbi:MAG: HlyD family efflux transporter periplasmic adaptor subunit [Verrucomicrobia bacterium]|nr:MAG: HlyD family efflux transporter periplasmic adaptor subunit [Verrucomicrobiota bacterium]